MAERKMPDGGMWNLPRTTISHDTKNLLQTMMQESRLTNFQQRQLDKAAKSGDSLPNSCHPTSSAKSRLPRNKNVIVGKVLNPRNCSSHVRTKEQIEATGAYDRDQFVPAPQTKFNGVYEKDKERLANMMAFGQDIAPSSETSKVVRRPQKPEVESDEEIDRFQELEKEVEERKAFLEKMYQLGKGKEYHTMIETQISQMRREMETIDERRRAELQQALANRQQHASSSLATASNKRVH